MDDRIKLAEEALPLTTGKILMEEPEAMTLGENTCSYAVCKILSDKLEARMKVLREHLLKQVEAHGEDAGDKGSTKLMVDGTLVIRERRESKAPDTAGIQKLLESRKMALTTVFDEKMSLELNISKVEHLVKLGKLPREEVDALKKVTFALKVQPAPMLQEYLDEGELPKKKKLFSR